MTKTTNHFEAWNPYFTQYRSYLLAFCYRMTGSLSESEDLVQDTFIACSATDPATVQNQKAWLTKIASNKALDHLKQAYKKRETYKGPWLPDAIPDSLQIWDNLNDVELPDKNLVLSESLTTSFLLLIERLTPEERAVYLLSEIFDYSYKEIAAYLEKNEEACRKIAQRARESITQQRPRFSPGDSHAEKLVAQFFAVARRGDKHGLMQFLAEGSEFWSDGGGKVTAAPHVINNRFKIATFFWSISLSKVFHSDEYKTEFSQINSRPGFIISKKLPTGLWEFETIFTFEVKDNQIARIFVQRNPDKLKSLLT